MKPSHLVGIYGNGEPGPDFSLPSTIQNMKDTVQCGENKKDLDDSRQRGEDRKGLDDSQHWFIEIPSFQL